MLISLFQIDVQLKMIKQTGHGEGITTRYELKIKCLIKAVYTRANKPRLTLAAAYIRRERNHLYEYGLY